MQLNRLALLGAVCLLVGCGSTPAGLLPGEELTFEPFKSTRVLDAATVEALGPLDAQGLLHVAALPSSLKDLKARQVLVGTLSASHPHGLLRMVTQVTPEADGSLTVSSVPVPPQLAFKRLHAKLKRTVADIGGAGTTWDRSGAQKPGGAHAQEDLDTVLYDADGDTSTTNDQLRLQGHLGGGYTYFLGIDFDWGVLDDLPGEVADCVLSVFQSCDIKAKMPELKIGYQATADSLADLTVTGQAYLSFEKTVPLANIVLDPPAYVVGPLVFVPAVTVTAKFKGEASADFALSTHHAATVGSELAWSSSTGTTWQPPSETHEDTVSLASVGLQAKVRAEVDAQLTVLLYDVLGPSATVAVWAELDADQTQSASCYTAKAGLDFTLGLEAGINVPGYGLVDFGHVDQTWPIIDGTLAQGSCEVPSGATTLGPGDGADAEHLAHPTFTPISRAWAGLIDSHPAERESVQGARLTRTIDGRIVAAGTTFTALSKFDEQGNLIWAREVRDTTFPTPSGTESRLLQPLAVAPTADAKLLVVTQPRGFYQVTQSGTVDWAKRVVLPDEPTFGGPDGDGVSAHAFTDVLSDGAGGFFVVGSHVALGSAPDVGPVQALLLHLDAQGAVTFAKTYTAPGHQLYPVRVLPFAGGLALVGLDWQASPTLLRRAFVLQVGLDGAPVSSKDYACSELAGQTAQFTTGLISHEGNLVLAGFQGDYDRGLVVGLRPDGSTAFAATPWTGSGLYYLFPRSLQELPTGGFALAGDAIYESNAEETMLAQLDAQGRMLWVDGYQLAADPGALGDSGRGALLRTDDGGLFSLSTSTAPNASSHGSVWLNKVYLRDGTITYGSGATRYPNRAHTEGACTLGSTAFQVQLAALDVALAPVSLAVKTPLTQGRLLTP
jgi:hypothetical protein